MKTNILRALSDKSFFNLWIGEVFTQISLNIFNFFLILIVFKQTHSNTAVSGAVLSFTIPAIIFGCVAGVFVDRWKKKRVLMLTNIFRGLLLLLLIFNLHNLVMIYLISFLVAILTQFFIPAESPIIPLIVEQDNLLAANALFGMGIFGSILAAFVFSGPLIILAGPIRTLLILALFFFISALFISFIKLRYGAVKTTKKVQKAFNIFRDIKHTLVLILNTKEISHSLVLLAVSQTLILLLATIAPGYANQVLGIKVEDFPLLFIAPVALGTIVGAVMMVNIFHSHPKEKVITAGILLYGLAMLFLPYGSKVASREFVHDLNMYLPHILNITILHIMVVIAFLLGIANSFILVPANTTLQEKTTDEFRGKIYGFLNTLTGVFSLFPIIIVGGLSDLIGVPAVIIGIGVSFLLIGVVRLFIK